MPVSTDPTGRGAAFISGISGDGSGVTTISALPQVTQIDPAFNASGSTLMIPNAIRTANSMSPKTYMSVLLPYAARSSPMTKAQAEEGDQR